MWRPLSMLAVALAIGIGVDFIRVEGDIARMNTVFKYYLAAWLLFGVSGAYGILARLVRCGGRDRACSAGRYERPSPCWREWWLAV